MGAINIYKIAENKRTALMQNLNEKMRNVGARTIRRSSEDELSFGFTLYFAQGTEEKNLSWNWLLRTFGEENVSSKSAPNAVLLTEKNGDILYAISYGHSYFLIDRYCDREFGFTLARKVDFQEIKTTTLTTPSSRRNKVVNTYINYSNLDFESGESYAKLKAKLKLPEQFTMFKPAVEIGTSIRVVTENDSLERIVDILLYIENIIENEEDKHKIPIFTSVKEQEKIEMLDEKLKRSIEVRLIVHISELDVIGVTEVFNRNDCEFKLKYKRKSMTVTALSNDELRVFCNQYGLRFELDVLDIMVSCIYEGREGASFPVKKLIDYTDDEERCLLSGGQWYQYNDDYLEYLRDSIAEIRAEYHPEFNFTKEIHEAFIQSKLEEVRNQPVYRDKTDEQIFSDLRGIYYAERAFNLLMERDYGFQNMDRKNSQVGTANVEMMDLYKDETMFAVKIGNTSSKLCYAVEQSLASLRVYKYKMLDELPPIRFAAIWLLLERNEHIENENGVPDINRLDMLMLKNRLDYWKKEVRLQGYTPVIYINYRTR